jgi:inorganic pyrophosphatase/exopolyphosphatase
MDPSAGIGTERDLRILHSLSPLSLSPGDELFPTLFNCKFDPQFWSELSVLDCLRFDYKLIDFPQWNIGISSIMIAISNPKFLEKDNLEVYCQTFMKENDLKFLILLSFSPTPTPQRELMVISEAQCDLDDFINYLKKDENQFLKLNRMTDQFILEKENHFLRNGLHCQIFSQENVKASRKIISPEIIRFQKFKNIAS